MIREIEASTAEEFNIALAEAGKSRSATFVFINDTDHDVIDLNHGWEYSSGGGLITIGATCYKHDSYGKTTNYKSGCMVRVLFNFKLRGAYYERQSNDAPNGKCYGRYRYRIYSTKTINGEEQIKHEVNWEEVFDE